MKAGTSIRILLPAIAVVTLATASSFWGQAAKPVAAKTTEELPFGPMQAKATTACTECHEARIIVQQRLSKAAWTKEVDKMMKWGALVDASDHDALIDYFSANFGPDQPAYQPETTTTSRKGTGKSSK